MHGASIQVDTQALADARGQAAAMNARAGSGEPPHPSPADVAIAPADEVARRITLIGMQLALIAVSVQSVIYLSDAALPGRRRLFDADDDGSAYAWMAVTATAAAALAAFLLANLLHESRRRFYPLAALLAFLSLDDMVQFHEELARIAPIPGVDNLDRLVWPILYLPVLAATFVLLETTARQTTEPLRRLIRVGLALLVAAVVLEVGAFALEAIDDTTRYLVLYVLEVAAEEGAELVGWIAIATALTAILASRLVRMGSKNSCTAALSTPSRRPRRLPPTS